MSARLQPNVLIGCAVGVALVAAIAYAAVEKFRPDDPRIAIMRAGAMAVPVVSTRAETYNGPRVVIVDGDTFAIGSERIRS